MQNDIVDNLFIDMNKEKSKAVVYCRQGDTLTRTIHIRLNDHGIPYDLSNVLFAEMLIVKPDGTECDNPMIRVDNELHYTFKTNDIAVQGECQCQVMLTFNDGAVVTSPTFSTYVYKKEIDQKKLRSSNEYGALTEMVVQANSYMENAKQSADNAKVSEEAAQASRAEAEEISRNVAEYVSQAEQFSIEAGESERKAETSALSSAESAQSAQNSMNEASEYSKVAETSADLIEGRINEAVDAATNAGQSALQAKQCEESALSTADFIKETAAVTKENKKAAALSETNARASETAAALSESNVSISAGNASTSEINAKLSETSAQKYAENARTSASSASTSATQANSSKTSASASATNAKASETAAKQSETNAAVSEQEAQKYAEQVKEISESFSGALRPLGTVTFAKLPKSADASSGDMYNVSDQFTTTADFKEGAGAVIPAGSNVYLTTDGMWDVLAGTPVTGVKGNKAKIYERGNVNITPEDVGAVNEDGGDASNTVVKFLAAASRSNIATGEKLSVLFGKIAKWFSDIKGHAFKDTVNNLTTTTTGSALDASQGKILDDKISDTNVAYCTCSTAAATAAKEAELVSNPNWQLKPGAIAIIRFSATNTASNCTINVNGTGAKPIWYNNAKYTGSSNYVCGYANKYMTYMYDGTYWVWRGHGADYNTTYGNMTGATASAAGKTGLVPAPAAGKQGQFLRGDGTWQTPLSVQNNLTSTSTTSALAAAQGKALNDKITKLTERVAEIEDMIGYPLEEEEETT